MDEQSRKAHELIYSAMSFIRTLTQYYGPDKGIELWNTISSTLDQEIRGRIFFTMLTGDHGGQIVIQGRDQHADRVRQIKALRSTGEIGLKEAVDLINNLDEKNIQIKVNVPTGQRQRITSDLISAGFILA